MKYIFCSVLIFLSFTLFGYSQLTYTYTVYPSEKRQEIDHFGASDCWVMQRFGKYASEDSINKVADLLFSTQFDENNNPKGIGLSMWRMNFGGGSDDNRFGNFRNIRARTACILKKNGTWDMDLSGSAGGQFNMLLKAKERGCEYTLGFVNSPPYFMTITGQTNGGDTEYKEKFNLNAEGVDKFTSYLADIVEKTKNIYDVTFDYIAPVNEPEWTHSGGEGNHANNIDIRNVCNSLSPKLIDKGVETKIVVAECGQHDYLYTHRDWPVPNDVYLYGKKIENFFGNPASPAYMGNLKNVARICSSHDYWTTSVNQIISKRKPIAEEINKYDAKFWASEYSLGDSFDNYIKEGMQNSVDLGMNYALWNARIMHANLSIANASAYHWWLALTDYTYLDGLIFLRRNNDYNVAFQMTSNQEGIAPISKYHEVYGSAEIIVPKALWGFGNFSRFIRPGATRLKIDNFLGVDNMTGFMLSAYVNKDGKRVIVCVNYSESSRQIKLKIDGESELYFTPYITSDASGDNLRPMSVIKDNSVFTMPKRAIVTFVEEKKLDTYIPGYIENQISWETENNSVKFKNAEGYTLFLYNKLGQCIYSEKIEDNECNIRVNQNFIIGKLYKDNKQVVAMKAFIQ